MHSPTPGLSGRLRQRVSRIPLRRRLVAGFIATMFVVLTGAGAFVYWRVQYALDHNLDTSLERAAGAIAPHVTPAGRLPDNDADLATIDGFQVLTARGGVLSHDGRLTTHAALEADDIEQAMRSPILRNTGELFIDTRRAVRLYAVPLPDARHDGPSGEAPAVLVVALDREQHDEALRELLGQLTAAGFATLVLTAVVGDLLARAALRPVEDYRRHATEIAAGATDLRLDVPADRDDEISRLGHTLNDMLEAQARALDRERRFTNDASHELRTPLTRLTSRVQLTLRRSRTVAEHERALEEIREDLTRLTTLADELLTLGTAGSLHGGGSGVHDGVTAGPTDLAAVVRKTASLRLTLAPSGSPYRSPGSLSVGGTGPAYVDVDGLRLERILDNLLDNAALHGRTPVMVSADVVPADERHARDPSPSTWVRLTVRDRGSGMAEELLATATERFARAPEARSRPGSGLGLALVSTLVEDAGGELRLCFAGIHHSTGRRRPVECAHDDAMSVTILLPGSSDPTS